MRLRGSTLTLVCIALGLLAALLVPEGRAQRAELFALAVFLLVAGSANAASRVRVDAASRPPPAPRAAG